jgi:hypothetical protein
MVTVVRVCAGRRKNGHFFSCGHFPLAVRPSLFGVPEAALSESGSSEGDGVLVLIPVDDVFLHESLRPKHVFFLESHDASRWFSISSSGSQI